MTPIVSVIVVSDYAPAMAVEQSYLERCLLALQGQDYQGHFEVIVVLPEASYGTVITHIQRSYPEIQVVETTQKTSFQMKNVGAKVAQGEIVAFLDGDCFAAPGWISAVVKGFEEYPQYSVMTGSTYYEEQNLMARSFCMISRAIMNGKKMDSTRRLANHNCAFRRTVFENHPFPDVPTAFGGTVFATNLVRSGQAILYNPAVKIIHVYEGWKAESDIRRNNGYAGIAYRLKYAELPHSWIVRWGYLAIPLLYLGRLAQFLWICSTRFKEYGIRWYELPYTMGLATVAFAQEIPGMLAAVKGRSLTETAYR